ncbi:MAG: hypothetical protein EBZ48_04440 [Proteobacteria bacterium]|nr:hypothetical protein [Pseudomonadota bacterium]
MSTYEKRVISPLAADALRPINAKEARTVTFQNYLACKSVFTDRSTFEISQPQNNASYQDVMP